MECRRKKQSKIFIDRRTNSDLDQDLMNKFWSKWIKESELFFKINPNYGNEEKEKEILEITKTEAA